ncbi:hypothetical protein B0J12DRAFT_741909 [Macrophomina phaseolina]|uniref:BTB/POZ-like protein n=1 Tax=Macrophomina phaseolina TaxID=35725 RepID=A0ABQ8G618_9PEZI|nr:hypothetical protein B0J12DRAFT_741909 [Macrophomina phaseolina]
MDACSRYFQSIPSSEAGRATIVLEDRAGNSYPVSGLNADTIGKRVPLLKESLDGRPGGPLTTTLGVPSIESGAAVIHYLYFGYYVLEGCDEPLKIQLLLHLEVFHIADYIGCAELSQLALGCLHVHTEVSLSYSSPLGDLVPAMLFAYTHLTEHPNVLETLLNYCVAAFSIHKLGENEEFKRLAATHETLVVDLSKVNAARDFENTDIPKLVGPKRPRGPLDFDIADIFAGPAIALDDKYDFSRRSSDCASLSIQQPTKPPVHPRQSSDHTLAEPQQMTDLPIRAKEKASTGKLDLTFVFPSGPVAEEPASPTSTDDGFVICKWPEEEESDSEWSLVSVEAQT